MLSCCRHAIAINQCANSDCRHGTQQHIEKFCARTRLRGGKKRLHVVVMVVWVVTPRFVMIIQSAAVNGMHRNGFQNCWRAANRTDRRNEGTAGGTRPELADCWTIIVVVTIIIIIIIIMRYRLYAGYLQFYGVCGGAVGWVGKLRV